MKAKFGVGTSDHCQARYLGSYDSDLTIGEVTATSTGQAGASSNVLGDLAGKGISAGKTNRPITQSFQEAGIVIGMHYFIPDAEYDSSFIEDFNSKLDRSDYFMPEYDSLGMMPLMSKNLPFDCSTITGLPDLNTVLGYQARYLEYKTRVNKVHGLFQSKASLRSWVTARNATFTNDWTSKNLLVNPKLPITSLLLHMMVVKLLILSCATIALMRCLFVICLYWVFLLITKQFNTYYYGSYFCI